MGATMRRLTSFECRGARLGASLDGAGGASGVLLVAGGTQTRIGSHRMYERLAMGLAEAGFPCLRFDRRGVGDSDGEDPGYAGSFDDLAAAAAAFRSQVPELERIYGFGLCDGATLLALRGGEAGLDGLVLANPWLVEVDADAPPAAAIRRRYRDRLLSLEGWKKILTGSISFRNLLKGISKAASPSRPSELAGKVAAGLSGHRLAVQLLMARQDATAIAAEHELKTPVFKGLPIDIHYISSDSHTFARPGDATALLAATLAAVRRLEGRARR